MAPGSRSTLKFLRRAEENPVAQAMAAWHAAHFHQAIRASSNPYSRFPVRPGAMRSEPRDSALPPPPPSLSECEQIEQHRRHAQASGQSFDPLNELLSLSIRRSADGPDKLEEAQSQAWWSKWRSILAEISGRVHEGAPPFTPQRRAEVVELLLGLAAEASRCTLVATSPTDGDAALDYAFRLLLNATRLVRDDAQIHVRLADLIACRGYLNIATYLYLSAAEAYDAENHTEAAAEAFAAAGLCWSSGDEPFRRTLIEGNGAKYSPERCFAAACSAYRQLGQRERCSICYVWSRDVAISDRSNLGKAVIAKISRLYWLYGESPVCVARSALGIILTCAVVYSHSGFTDSAATTRPEAGTDLTKPPAAAPVASSSSRSQCSGLPADETSNLSQHSPLTAIYFSCVTFSTLGYGDVQPGPRPTTRLLAALEGLLGAFSMSAFLVAVQRRYVGW